MKEALLRILLVSSILAAATVPDALQSENAGEFEVRGEALRVGEVPAIGGGFALAGTAVAVSSTGGDFALLRGSTGCQSGRGEEGTGGCGCLCSNPIFSDGFESGDTGAW